MISFSISATPIDTAALSRALHNSAAGALSTFEGWVRNHNEGKAVSGLEYEVFHALADVEGVKILNEAMTQFGLLGACAVHREGSLQVGGCAVWVGAIAAHRAEAFAGCRYIIDAVKHRLPIWKKEHYLDGKAEWVGCAHNHGVHPHPEKLRA